MLDVYCKIVGSPTREEMTILGTDEAGAGVCSVHVQPDTEG